MLKPCIKTCTQQWCAALPGWGFVRRRQSTTPHHTMRHEKAPPQNVLCLTPTSDNKNHLHACHYWRWNDLNHRPTHPRPVALPCKPLAAAAVHQQTHSLCWPTCKPMRPVTNCQPDINAITMHPPTAAALGENWTRVRLPQAVACTDDSHTCA